MAAVEVNEVYPSYELLECPYPFFEKLRAGAPVYKVPGRDEYVVSKHADIQYALRNDELFSTVMPVPGLDYKGATTILTTEPVGHKQKRKLAWPPFTPGRLRAATPMVQRHVDQLIDGFIGRGEVDFVEEFAFVLPIMVISDMMGLPLSGPKFEGLKTWSHVDRSNMRYFAADDERVAEIMAYVENMLDYFASVVQDRHDNPGEDIISELVRRQVARDGTFELEYLTTITAELVAGGVTTTAHMLGSAMMLLLQNPEELAKVEADHALIPRVLEETLRVELPVQWRARIATEDVELSGTTIPAGSRVLLLFASGSRDEAVFEDSERFCPSRPYRELKKHFGFGHGSHFCLGAPLARLEGQLALETFFTRIKNVAPIEGRNDFAPLDHLHFRAPKAVHLQFEKA